jgi:hypothetical protein
MLLLEAGFTVAFLGSDQTDPPRTILILVAWLVFRLEFGAGMIKIRGGREWRDLTALYYHHETQPMPGPLSRQAHLLPKPFHRLEVVGNHFAQLVVPFLPLRAAAAGQHCGGHHHLHPAVAGGQRQFCLAELDCDCAGLRRRQRSRGACGAAGPSAGMAHHRGDAAVVASHYAGRVPAPGGPQLLAHPQSVLPVPADERQLQPLAAGEHVRRVRHGHQAAHRSGGGGHP